MSQTLESFYNDIKTNLTTIIQPRSITKNTETSFEIWSTHDTSCLFFCSINLHPDHIYIKFSPNQPEEYFKVLRLYIQNNHSEFYITESDISEILRSNLKNTIVALHRHFAGKLT